MEVKDLITGNVLTSVQDVVIDGWRAQPERFVALSETERYRQPAGLVSRSETHEETAEERPEETGAPQGRSRAAGIMNNTTPEPDDTSVNEPDAADGEADSEPEPPAPAKPVPKRTTKGG